jgi:hypothetical protein
MSAISNYPNESLDLELSAAQQRQAGKLTAKLEQLIEVRRKAEKLEGELKVDLKDLLKPAYFGFNATAEDQNEVVHSFDVGGLQVNFVNSYVIKDSQHAQTLAKLLGEGHPLLDYIQDSQHLTVDLTGLTKDEMLEVSRSITEATAEYGLRPTVKTSTVIDPEFHNERHVVLSAEDNLVVDKTLPVQVQVALIE